MSMLRHRRRAHDRVHEERRQETRQVLGKLVAPQRRGDGLGAGAVAERAARLQGRELLEGQAAELAEERRDRGSQFFRGELEERRGRPQGVRVAHAFNGTTRLLNRLSRPRVFDPGPISASVQCGAPGFLHGLCAHIDR